MNFILFDDNSRANLFPFTHTRPVADIRCGIFTMRERWEHFLQKSTSTLTLHYLQPVYQSIVKDDNIYINGSLFADSELLNAINNLPLNYVLMAGETVLAARLNENKFAIDEFLAHLKHLPVTHFEGEVHNLKNPWDIFSMNDKAIRDDFKIITSGRKSASIPDGVVVTGKDNIFIEESANIYPGCIINAMTGPVYIGKDVEVLEGTMIRGPLALGDHGVIKMGAKIYGATTIGPGCKVGGEINNVVFFENSNKSHDGYLGNAVIGEWCNLGADTNCSNLKNNYDEVKVWHEASGKMMSTGLIFCGLLMGDHSKCGINTMFNTGTVVGVSCNIFGSGFPEKFVPSFSWGGSDGMKTYAFDKAMDTANRMMGRRGRKLTEAEIDLFKFVFDHR